MKILFLSLSDREVLHTITFDRLRKYCIKYNYDFHHKTHIIDKSRHIAWSKILFLLEQMDHYPNYDFYIWMDDDIYITNFNTNIYNLIYPYSFNCLLLSEDVIPECPLNSGVLVCKNNIKTKEILNAIYNMVDETGTRFKHNWEQDALIKYYNNNKNNNIVIIPHKIIQSFHRNYSLPDNRKWQPNDFCAHITGMSIKDRLVMLKELMGMEG